MSLNDFVTLSELLIGVPFQPPLPPLTSLDPDLAGYYLTQLRNLEARSSELTPPASTMDTLLATWVKIQQAPAARWVSLVQAQIMDNATLGALARQIILAWYNGFHPWSPGTQPTPDLGSYEQTLVWVLAQAHPVGVPLSFGYWQSPPGGGGSTEQLTQLRVNAGSAGDDDE